MLFIIWRTLPDAPTSRASSGHIDYLGAAVLVAALVPILIGLTNKQFGEWTDPDVGGLIAARPASWPRSSCGSSRAPRSRSCRWSSSGSGPFTASVFAMFLAAMGFFAAVVFLPRWYQVVQGASATESGYQILPLLGGLIVSAIASGQIVARTGRYKALIVGALVSWRSASSCSPTSGPIPPARCSGSGWPSPGLGVGPAFAVFTLAVQNAVPVRELGAAPAA